MMDTIELNDKQKKSRRGRNIALGVVLVWASKGFPAFKLL